MDALPRPEFWDWFQNPAEAEAARRGLATPAELMAVALDRADVRSLVDEMGGSEMPYFELLRTATPASGELLGYEVVGAEHTFDIHSWHCHAYADQVNRDLGIRVNDFGLLPTYDEAAKVLAWMLARPIDEAPSPVPWTVVALLRGVEESATTCKQREERR